MQMVKHYSLLMNWEAGSDPNLGGAFAESDNGGACKKHSFGIVTTITLI
jgi:hypothetical protein